ncbi:MAG: ribosome maturation factor RimM [Firmicutes bacterium]|jgi:16S rRNA processing protein RimM|uniref:Ribosome maturation factor RimM n=1 Tax=Sulfobacillus benefaciens TaxID=453960 RepID=A0A2T2XAL1_9FIRM|nr:ribosome maturation factor RimM [Bacillota bacterium]MCL5014384.1 ribosome maturation factor RimM [Bacillota bacterium]PSR31486.1 MAG: 16S rRNA processing protein RimM [Sulfobacillus benefaciens]HBQ96045.1 16S rRNA processing protein RimM [Sulfobacillus sp.]
MRNSDWSEFVAVGEITTPHGLNGAFRVFPTTDFPDRLLKRKTIWVASLSGPQTIRMAKFHPPVVILQLEGITTREEAETLRGEIVYVPINSLPPLGPQEYYWFQLQGLHVLNDDTKEIIGTVSKMIRTGANQDVFEVVRPEKAPLLIPALKSVVTRVSLEEGIMTVKLPEGLDDSP